MLPIETKQAMLVGLDNETIITGAYTHDGGICPMLAAHRRGGRTDRESFAQCWDRYTGADKGRRASEREVRTLRTMLEASLMEPEPISLGDAAADVRAQRDRTPAIAAQHDGWSWSRLFRRWDTYAAAIGPLEDGVAPDRGREESPVVVADLAGQDGVRPVTPV